MVLQRRGKFRELTEWFPGNLVFDAGETLTAEAAFGNPLPNFVRACGTVLAFVSTDDSVHYVYHCERVMQRDGEGKLADGAQVEIR